MHELLSLKSKSALITGAASGIGAAVALRFAEAGADLTLVDINQEGLERVKQQLSNYNHKFDVYQVDLSRKTEIDSLWNKLENKEPDICDKERRHLPA